MADSPLAQTTVAQTTGAQKTGATSADRGPDGLTVREAAAELGITPGRVRQLIATGALADTAPNGSAPLVAAAAVREVARQHAQRQFAAPAEAPRPAEESGSVAGHVAAAAAASTSTPAPAALASAGAAVPAVATPLPAVLGPDGSLPTPEGVRRPRPVVRRRVLFDPKALEGIFDRVVNRLPMAISAGVEPLRVELAAARAALEEQSRLRMQAEARAVTAERELEFLRARIAEAEARPAGLFRRRPRPIVLPQQA